MTEVISKPAVGVSLFTAFVEYIDRSAKTTRTYLTNLRQFMAWLKFSAITEPARQDIINYREWLTAEHDAIELAPQPWRAGSIGLTATATSSV